MNIEDYFTAYHCKTDTNNDQYLAVLSTLVNKLQIFAM